MNNVTTKMIAAIAVSGMLIAGTESQGDVITSNEFSFGYGFDNFNTVGGAWNTVETAGVNTSTVQGDFSLSPNVTGSMFSGGGTFFPNRILTDNGVIGAGQILYWESDYIDSPSRAEFGKAIVKRIVRA